MCRFGFRCRWCTHSTQAVIGLGQPCHKASPSFARQLVVSHAEPLQGPISINKDRLIDPVPKAAAAAATGKGLWTRCEKCGVILYIKHLKEHNHICFGCNFHLKMSSAERIEHMIDPGTWRSLDDLLSPMDPLEFFDLKAYPDRIKEAQDKTGMQDGLRSGTGLLHGIPVALGVMEFGYMGGSMGSVVGEKLTRLIEYATQEGLSLIIVSTSGGARMQEGIFSLMQVTTCCGCGIAVCVCRDAPMHGLRTVHTALLIQLIIQLPCTPLHI